MIFAEPDTINPNDDAILADSLRRNGRAVLPVVLDRLDHPGSMSLPIPALAQAAAGWASSTRASTPTAWCAKACCACTTTATGGAIWP